MYRAVVDRVAVTRTVLELTFLAMVFAFPVLAWMTAEVVVAARRVVDVVEELVDEVVGFLMTVGAVVLTLVAGAGLVDATVLMVVE
jgi:hypothetical protein